MLEIPVAELEKICTKYGLKELALFGSAIRDDFTETSDVDVLVEPGPTTPRGYFALSQLEDDLERVFGRTVDVVTPGALSPYIRDEVLRSRRSVYVATH